MHLQGTDGGGKYRNMGFQTTVAALDIPELLKTNISSKATLGNVVFKHLQAETVSNDRRLAYGDIGKGAGMDHAGLILYRAA